jgi:hypothetical protein
VSRRDLLAAADQLIAFRSGEDSEEARAGALFIAEFMGRVIATLTPR